MNPRLLFTRRTSLAMMAVVLATVACASPLPALLPGTIGGLVTSDPLASATPTPFGPVPPTGTALPTATSTATPPATATSINPWGSFPGPREPSATEIPREAPHLASGPGVTNIIVLGSDQRPDSFGFRTDVMMIASLDSEKGTVTLVSFPRDLYVYQPGWRMDRINTADARGGPDLVGLTMLYNFGVDIHHYLRINFSGFMSAIDTLGGIDVQVGRSLFDRCGRTQYSYVPGVYHMDGFTALCYVRMRKTTSDFDRLRREQEVLLAFFSRLVTLDGLARVPEIYGQMHGLVQSDIGLTDLLGWIPLAQQVATDPSRFRRFTLDTSMADGWTTPSGGAVQLPVRDRVLAMMAAAFGP